MIAAAAGEEPGLEGDQRQRVVGDDAGGAERLAAVDVEPGRHVDGEDARAERGELGDAGDRGGELALGRRDGADAEEGVDDQVGAIARDRFGAIERAHLDAGIEGTGERLRRVGRQRSGVADAEHRRRLARVREARRRLDAVAAVVAGPGEDDDAPGMRRQRQGPGAPLPRRRAPSA